jgi:putative ABC transport system substrate-binding protein
VTTRRRFLHAAVAGLLVDGQRAFAQVQGKVHRIGYLNLRAGPSGYDEAFLQGMRELGYTVGRNLVVDYRWAASDMARLQPFAEELVRLKVDVIVTATTPAITAAMRATSTIPIVMTATADPVGTGLVASLGRPGGNLTGMTLQSTDLARRRLQLLRDLVPGANRIGMLTLQVPDSLSEPNRQAARLLATEMQIAATQLGIRLIANPIATADDLPEAFARFRREQAQAVFVQVNPLTLQHRPKIAELAARERLPAMYEIRDFVDDGGLVSYGPDLHDMYRRAASFVDRIFKGAKPGELAIEQPTKFEFVVNGKAAKALGLTIPQSVMVQAEVI